MIKWIFLHNFQWNFINIIKMKFQGMNVQNDARSSIKYIVMLIYQSKSNHTIVFLPLAYFVFIYGIFALGSRLVNVVVIVFYIKFRFVLIVFISNKKYPVMIFLISLCWFLLQLLKSVIHYICTYVVPRSHA